MRVLVTGGAGFIGSHLVDRFLREGFQVRVLDSLDPKIHPEGQPVYIPDSVEFIRGDVNDPNALLAALEGIDIVSHQAAYQDYMPDFSRFLRVNGVGTALLYELIVARKLKVKKIVVASSQAVYGEGQYTCAEHGFFLPFPRSQAQLLKRQWEVRCPTCDKPAEPNRLEEGHSNPFNQYAVSKLAEEKIALGLGWLYGIPTVALRYSITQGPRQSLFNQYSGICRIFVGRAFRGEPLIVYEDGRQTRDFVHIADVVDANMLVLEKQGANFQAFNVGSGNATTVLEYASLVRERFSPDVRLAVSGEFRRGDNRHSVSSIETLTRLGWRAKRGLATILDDFLCWVESLGGIPSAIPDAYSDMQNQGVVVAAVPITN
ncbi:MAG TPA: NAD-dependent epimerase/dehydratase family protein [Candidatus Acidoferrum sp.]|nr:NAD-dependent epimerase/dehydratase family protein [Candidatus Acidoferrum sp.]